MRRLTIEEFITKARAVHGDKYDYSKVEYVGSKTKVIIICPDHGEFEQSPHGHLQGRGCPDCAVKSRAKTTEEFITEAKKAHGDRYDYSKVEYTNNKTKVIIICPDHGEFEQSPHGHLQGKGCPKCSGFYSPSTEEFKAKAKEVHGKKYDYSKVEYTNNKTKVIIICPDHGEFEQRPNDHLQGKGCLKCSGLYSLSTEEFKAKAKEVHGKKYDYSKVEYVNTHTKVIIICPEHGHGEFEQTPGNHLQGHGCPDCANKALTKTTEEFITEAKKAHGDKYDYSKVEYVNTYTKVIIICPDHGEFEQRPDTHLQGHGCLGCVANVNFTSEPILRKVLEEVTSLKFPKKRPKWLKNPDTKRPLEIDCYNQELKIGFELQGRHHYGPIKHWGGEESFQKVFQRDQIKKTICEEKGIHLFCIDQRPATGKTPQEKEEYYKKEIKKCLQQLPQHVKIRMNRR